MNSQVFYRKWRPQTFAEVVGQEPITRTLLNALATGRVAHAYLFCGPRGTGKTSTGRLLAKAVNCLQNGRGEPCSQCSLCQAIAEGRALDLIEIDAASNRGIDDIRDLRDKVNFAPNEARYKVYIIDEVHMLTSEAFNALLKTLEEPPAHAIFVLATTEVHRVPATILSRCQRFDFRRLPLAAVVERLGQVCRGEGLEVEPGVLELVARSATGSLRDAENILEQLGIYFGQRITMAQAQTLLGLMGDARVGKLAHQMLKGELATALATLSRVVDDGLDLRQFHRELIEYLRSLLWIKAGAASSLDLTEDALAERKALAEAVGFPQITTALRLVSAVDLRYEAQRALPLEMALAQYHLAGQAEAEPPARAKEERAMPRPQLSARASGEPQPSLSAGPSRLKPTPPSVPARAAPPEPSEVPEPTPRETIIPKAEPAESLPKVSVPRPTPLPSPGPGLGDESASGGLERLKRHWSQVLEALHATNRTAEALLRSGCRPLSVENEIVTLGFYHQFHRDKVDSQEHRRLVEAAISQVLGTGHHLRCVLAPRETTSKAVKESPLVQEAVRLGAQVLTDEEEELFDE